MSFLCYSHTIPYFLFSVWVLYVISDDYHNMTVREFEEILVKYLKGGYIKPNRPTMIMIGGTCGCGGKRMDAIDLYTFKFKLVLKKKNVKRTFSHISFFRLPYTLEYRTQIDTRKAKSYGFAPFRMLMSSPKLLGENIPPKGTDIWISLAR